MLLYQNQNSRIELHEGLVIKTRPAPKFDPLHEDWLPTYNKLYEMNPYLVKVHEASSYRIVMEHLDILDHIENLFKKDKNYPYLNKDLISDIIIALNSIWADSMKLSRDLDGYFINNDLSLNNIVLTKNREVKIIDPESFVLVPKLIHTEKYLMAQFNLNHHLQRYFLLKSD